MLLLRILIVSLFFTITQTPFDVRQTRWGMSKAQVRASEKIRPILEEADSLTYAGISIGMKVNILYSFNAGRLSSVKVQFADEHSENALFVQDFNSINWMLTAKYGPVANQEVMWLNEQYKDQPESLPLALALGQVKFVYWWDTARTTVGHMLKGDNYQIAHSLKYTPAGAKTPKQTGDDL